MRQNLQGNWVIDRESKNEDGTKIEVKTFEPEPNVGSLMQFDVELPNEERPFRIIIELNGRPLKRRIGVAGDDDGVVEKVVKEERDKIRDLMERKLVQIDEDYIRFVGSGPKAPVDAYEMESKSTTEPSELGMAA